MSYKIEFIENNLIFNEKKECYAYFELVPYNYSFLGLEQKQMIHDNFNELVKQVNTTYIHALKIATELSIESIQEQSKKHVKGDLKELAYHVIDTQTDMFKEEGFDRQIDYRYFLGFKLEVAEKSMTAKNILNEVKNTLLQFLYEVNHKAFDDFLVKPEDDLMRFVKAEQFLKTKIERRFRMRTLSKDDMGYIISHLNFKTTDFYEDYYYHLPKVEKDGNIVLKKYDIEKLGRVIVEEKERYLKIKTENKTLYATYFAIEDIMDDLQFPHAEILYWQQQQFNFAVDVSMTIEKIPYHKALPTVINKKKTLKDQENHAVESGYDVSQMILEKKEQTEDLEDELRHYKEDMYKLNYLVRVSASNLEELKLKSEEIIDYYLVYNIKLVHPLGNMIDFHQEFMPACGRKVNDYLQYVRSDFLASLGFGATTQLGEKSGIFIGWNRDTGQPVYIRPDLAAQGVSGSITNALAKVFIGSLGGGKSLAFNLVTYLSVLFGAKSIIIDPKSERGKWKEDLPEIEHAIDIINITSDEQNRGMLDPFVLIKNQVSVEGTEMLNAESLVLDILTFLTGVSIHDHERMPLLREAVKRVAKQEQAGMLKVIDELRSMETKEALELANHIAVFTDYDFAKLLFSDGNVENTINDYTNCRFNFT